MQKALNEKNSEFEFLRCFQDRAAAKMYYYSTTKVIYIFKDIYASTYKAYLKQIKTGTQDLQTIIALKQFKQCVDYYERERRIAADMLDEYSEYVLSGHVIDTLVGNYRSDEDLWDHRRKDGK